MKTPNKIDYVEFPTNSPSDLARAKDFFGAVFEWKYQDWGNEYADAHDSGPNSGISADANEPRKHPLVIIYVDDLETAKERVIGAGGTVTVDIFAFPGGRRFHFREPTGNELAAWSDK